MVKPNVSAAIWALSLSTPIGLLFAFNWQPARIVVAKEHVWKQLTKPIASQSLSEFLLRPEIRNVLIVWFVVFWICLVIPLALGFGPAGVIGGSLAAWFRSTMYGAFTPAGGLFAVMTSVGMLGIACPPIVIPSVIVATLATLAAW
ncbi:unnamed protein product [Rhizoctonia solani]|uniref:Uncharacterized protein n=1 Tax=Rhizoctonia solani TaxID=456999 RepID=A0A8H3H0H4_9AGAM|nr:unnamed protein product [Rhizoctonia solani]